MSIQLNDILVSIAEQCKVPIEDVKNAVLQVGVDCSRAGLPRVSSSSQFKNPCVPLPEKVDGGAVDQMTVTELRDVLGNAESAEAAWPFLLRFVLGEFHYGQRVTGLQPGQKPGRASSVSGSTLAGTGKDDEALDPITKQNLKAFDVMAAESRYRHLHQVSQFFNFTFHRKFEHEISYEIRQFQMVLNGCFPAICKVSGWIDITSKVVWDNYVRDVINNKIAPGDRVFEAGLLNKFQNITKI